MVLAGAGVAGVVDGGVVDGGVVDGFVVPSTIPSEIAVAISTLPVAASPRLVWYAETAAVVPAPNIPSTPPLTEIEALTKDCCNEVTRAPR